MFLAIVFSVLSTGNFVYAEETPDELKELYARSAVLMDADSGRILFGKNESDVLPMASTTKIMTCIIALENMKKNQICEVSEIAVQQPKVHLGVRTGEKYYLEDLLYSLMLESHNDSAVIIAETIGGSVEAFVDMMNIKAKELGCTDTYFITPNGLDDKNEHGIHSTTSKDLAQIMRYCIVKSSQKDKFLKITRAREYRFSDIEGKRKFVCHNHNLFLDMMAGALSGKTGFTNDAGYCYVGALKKDERTFIVALLACGWPGNKEYKWLDTRKIMEYALRNYDYKTVFVYNKCDNVSVLNGVEENNPLKSKETVNTITEMKKIRVLMNGTEKIDKKIIMNPIMKAPVSRGEKTGTIYYVINEHVLESADIVTEEEVAVKSIGLMWQFIIDKYMYYIKSENES